MRLLTLTTKSLSQSVSNSASQAVITKLLPVEHMVHYTHSVFSECVVESHQCAKYLLAYLLYCDGPDQFTGHLMKRGSACACAHQR